MSKEREGGLFKVLSHPIRVKLVELLHENIQLSYTEILNTLKIDAGQLNFHLKNMKDLYVKSDGNYLLSDKGKFAYDLITEVKKIEGKKEVESTLQSAPVYKRILASLIDAALFVGSPILVVLIASLLFPPSNLDPILLTIFVMLIMFLSLLVLTSMEASSGQTIGKYIMGIRVVKDSGMKIDLAESAIRNVGKIYLLPIDLLLGFLLKKKGYLRFTCFMTKSKVIEV
jgi:uncharacterized RDD family membrane protein YckC